MKNQIERVNDETEWGHEVRMHMQILISGIQMLKSRRLSEEQKTEYLEIMDRHAREVVEITEETIERQGFLHREARMKTEGISQMLRDCLKGMKASALQKELTVLEDVEEEIFAETDRRMLLRVIENLLYNAVKFTADRGYVHLQASRQRDQVEILISDTGCGIEPERMEGLFRWKDASMIGGHGIGLPMCARLVEKMGGTIACESQVGKGSTFMVSLPCVSPF